MQLSYHVKLIIILLNTRYTENIYKQNIFKK